jgi:hypothetical protein
MASRASASLGPADPPEGSYAHELRSTLEHSLVSWELEEQHELGAMAGVSLAHPYWDPDLVDALLRTPPAALSRNGRSKGLVRQTMARRFPTLGLDRQRKVSGTAFYRAVLAREGTKALRAVEDFSTLDALGVVDGRPAREWVRDAAAGNRWPDLWTLASVEAWAKAHA